MSGVSLLELDSSDLLDVLHYMFEVDITSLSTEEQVKIQSSTRKHLYSTLYQAEYKYEFVGTSYDAHTMYTSASGEDFSDEDDTPIVPLDPLKKKVTPFVPATKVEAESSRPYGRNVDAPLG